MNGMNCVSSETPVCPDGTRFNGKACVSTAEKPFCADAASFFSNNTCVISKALQCPELSTLNKGECVSSTLPVCQNGTVISGDNCLTNTQPQRPDGFTLKDRVCASSIAPSCPCTLVKGSCVSKERPFCPGRRLRWPRLRFPPVVTAISSLTAKSVCPPYHLSAPATLRMISKPVFSHSLRYVRLATYKTVTSVWALLSPGCPEGTTFNAGVCVSITRPQCDGGMTFDGKACVSTAVPKCPDGPRPKGFICVGTEGPKCPPGTRIEGCRCVRDVIPECLDIQFCPPAERLALPFSQIEYWV